ncbi:c-type cytochrome [Rarobacter faecitabidus]|uniref:Cytochrome bc1 complex cytochrome c subunit n=1 Tax=Rarobacter faecitabidus TaxID=13243 RepID=A0A542ZVF8_RARFA|nr:c-type cytochrome [Rarobacter faecitabidus]TQL64332.1 menaquinol-cytochrome c reductase cytochrome c1 subunit precursor [Rarobacter faecitabidus]
MKAIAARRHHRFAPLVLVMLALLLTGALYAAFAPSGAQAEEPGTNADDIAAGAQLFQANCATCHGVDASGREGIPSLIGVGAAAVDFQVSTGRMPMQSNSVQAPVKPVQFDETQIRQLAAFVASLGPGPEVPSDDAIDPEKGNPALGAEIFRTNCAMCHNAVGAGGALSEGKYAPDLWDTTPRQIYEAMVTGPQSMPVFNEHNITPEEKRDLISYVVAQREGSPGGNTLGSLGPVSEGLWAFVLGIGALIGAAVWVGAKSS